MTEKLLTYALGPGPRLSRHAGGPRDRPRRRPRNDYRFSSLVLGIVNSVPFQMRMAQEPAITARHGRHASHRDAGLSCTDPVSMRHMFITKLSLPRRTFLRGMGATVALPLLEAMVPALTAPAKTAGDPPPRFGAVYMPNGAIMDQWIPETAGAGFEFTPILKPLEPFRESLVVVSNLDPAHPGVVDGDHAVSAAGWLTGVLAEADGGGGRPWRTRRSIRSSPSRSARTRRFRRSSWRPRISRATSARARRGFSCAYMNTISWSTPTTPLPMEINPRVVFERLFGRPGTAAERAAAHARGTGASSTRSSKEASDLQRGLGPRDRDRLSEYLDNIREIERRIQRAEAQSSTEVTSIDAPVGVPESFEEHVGADVRPAGAGVPGRPDARLHVHDRSASSASARIRRSASPSRTTRCRTTATTRTKIAKVIKINTYHVGAVREVPGEAAIDARRRRLAARSLADSLRQRHGQPEPACERSAAARGGRRRCRQGQPAHPAAAAHAGRQSVAVGGPQVRQRHRQLRREHGDGGLF